jgi:hypothetical protein
MEMREGWQVERVRHTVSGLVVLAAVLAAWSESAAGPPPRRPPREVCRLLDDPQTRPLMDAVLNHLLPACGREHELGGVLASPRTEPAGAAGDTAGPDVPVSDPSGDSGISQTQSETSLARNDVTGTLCSGYND